MSPTRTRHDFALQPTTALRLSLLFSSLLFSSPLLCFLAFVLAIIRDIRYSYLILF